MTETLEFEAFSVVRIVLVCMPFLAGIFAGVKAADRWNNWAGWVVGILVCFAVYAFFFPVIELLQEKMCRIDPLMEDCY
jgi:hypothetical protein